MRRLFAALTFLCAVAPAAVLPGLADTIQIREWLVCGPFSVGTREGITGVVEDPLTFRPSEGDTYRSGLVQNGITTCRKVTVDSLGWLNTDYQDVRWDTLQDYYGNVGVACAGFTYAEFDCPRACRALALAPKLGGFVLNGLGYLGDVYGNGWFQVPVQLDSGRNRVLLRVSGYGNQQVRFLLAPPPAPFKVVADDITAPDLVADSSLAGWLGIPVLNTTPDRLDTIRLAITLPSGDTVGKALIFKLPGFGAQKVPVRISIPAQPFDTAGLALVVNAACAGDSRSDTVHLRIRRPEQSRKVTFVTDIDSSCQYYSVLYPKDYDPAKRYALILSLHGAGVEASGQADAYRPKDWAFVVAATNRRPFGFDWQDWGRLDAIEVLDRVVSSLPIDRDRVLLSGHSMGGHGTWHVGLTHSDRFAAAAPEAGWPDIQLYVPMFLQRAAIFADPSQLAVRDMAMRPDNVPAMLVNALNLPLFILHGGDDDNVPTIHGRTFAEWLRELGHRFTYKEVPNRPHWWSYEDGLACVDDTNLMNFLKSQRRDPGPRHIRFRTADLGQSNRSYWAVIERARVVGRDADIEAWATDSLVTVKTTNVSQFSLELAGQPFFPGRVAVVVDGKLAGPSDDVPAHLTFHHTDKGWTPGPARAAATTKTPNLYGPVKQAMMKPFLLVYGTTDAGLTDFLRHSATQEGMRWWLVGNGRTQVVPDSEVTASDIARYNLVLYGGPKENSITSRIADRLPIRVKAGRMSLGSSDLGDSLAAMFVYPNPLNRDRLVLVRMGTDPNNTRLSMFWGVASSGTGIPDFLIFDRSVRRYGWTGVRAAGFFGPDWNLDPASAYVRE
ncbi:MAG: prolyl oligopeptidase family serine peptidase [candidate division WOR-3 bacterium]|nr:prolyl oligopeptidase family serine peptidase [candidate division WOR-3 bacterium]